MNTSPTPLPAGAACAHHPDRSATRACARCGTFVCRGCLVGDDLCTECKRRLLQEGIPWTPQEKARSVARRRVNTAEILLRSELVVGVLATLTLTANAAGNLPSVLRPAGLGLWAVTAVLGMAVVGVAVGAWRASQAGRPGPAVSGVVSPAETAQFVVLGSAPLVAVLSPLVQLLGGG